MDLIEEAFLEIREMLYRAEGRSREALIEAMSPALSAVSAACQTLLRAPAVIACWSNGHDKRSGGVTLYVISLVSYTNGM